MKNVIEGLLCPQCREDTLIKNVNNHEQACTRIECQYTTFVNEVEPTAIKVRKDVLVHLHKLAADGIAVRVDFNEDYTKMLTQAYNNRGHFLVALRSELNDLLGYPLEGE